MNTLNENLNSDPKKNISSTGNGPDEFSDGSEKYDDRFEDNEDDAEQYDGKEHPQVEDEKDADDEEEKDNGIANLHPAKGGKSPGKRS